MIKRLLLLLLLLSVLMYTGCGGGGGKKDPYGGCIIPSPEDNEVFSSLGGGRVVDVAKFNGKGIYTTVTALTANKLEGYGDPPVYYSGKLLTTTGITESHISSFAKNRSAKLLASNFISKQAEHDLLARQAENDALARRVKQFSKKISDINFAAPSPAEKGTPWNGVKITTDGTSSVLINTTCQYVSNSAYFFVDDENTTDLTLEEYGAAFDAIYLKNREKFGKENDVDGNGKVIIVFTPKLSGDFLGYFYAIDKFSSSDFELSNEGDIFYVTTTPGYQGDTIKATLAHEFQHMIYFDQHYNSGVTNTQTWLNEALSQAAEYYSGYTESHLNWIKSFLAGGWYGLSLTYWTSYNYGYGAIFIRYLIDQYRITVPDLTKLMCSTGFVGIAAVESATGNDFNTIFYNFSRALVLSGTGVTTDERYNFTSLILQDIQSDQRRKGLLPIGPFPAGDGGTVEMYPYEIYFTDWYGEFGTMQLSGDLAGDVFGIENQ